MVPGPGCSLADSYGEQFTIYTNASQAALKTNMAPLFQAESAPGSSSIAITGPGFVISLTGVDTLESGGNGTTFFISAATVAQRVHGTVVK